MKILFIDWAPFAYDSNYPLSNPLGGTQSAAAYLAVELGGRGHRVAFINQIESEREVHGVLFTNLPKPISWINEFDAIVSVSGLQAETLRSIGCSRPIVAWCPHDTNQSAVAQLADPVYQNLYSGFAFVSEWQRDQYLTTFGLDPSKVSVMRNALAPPFLAGERDWRWLDGSRPPLLTYTSTPFRGLDILLLAFPMIRRSIPDARLRIHGGMKIYGAGDADKSFMSLYELARALPGIENIGPVGQVELAQSLMQTDILAYPCTFRETSCISAMEAAASGLYMVTTRLGALPETTAGFAQLLDEATPSERSIMGMFATRYADQFVSLYEEAIANPGGTQDRLQAQMMYFRERYTWQKRSLEWQSWLETLI